MIKSETDSCPKCGGELKYYDSVIRIQKFPEGKIRKKLLSRMKCRNCGSLHRVIPEDILPYKQYARSVVESNEEYLDYPSESSIYRWHAKNTCNIMRNTKEANYEQEKRKGK